MAVKPQKFKEVFGGGDYKGVLSPDGVVISIAAGLAFGLGGKEAAARTIEKVRSEIGHDRS